jgi:hypothetical protein
VAMLSGAQRAKPASSPKRMIIITTAALDGASAAAGLGRLHRRPSGHRLCRKGFTDSRQALKRAGLNQAGSGRSHLSARGHIEAGRSRYRPQLARSGRRKRVHGG